MFGLFYFKIKANYVWEILNILCLYGKFFCLFYLKNMRMNKMLILLNKDKTVDYLLK